MHLVCSAAGDAFGVIVCGYWNMVSEFLSAWGEVELVACAPKYAAGVGVYLDVYDF
jgi:hypothetical protein